MIVGMHKKTNCVWHKPPEIHVFFWYFKMANTRQHPMKKIKKRCSKFTTMFERLPVLNSLSFFFFFHRR